MPLGDLVLRLLDVIPVVMLLCIAVGAGVLWHRTRRSSSLAQFVGSLLLFAGFAISQLRLLSTSPYSQSAYAEALRSDTMRTLETYAAFIGIVIFAFGFLRYALTSKRI